MTREEAIEYAEKKNLKLEEEIERPGSYYGAYAMYSTELEFVSMAISALRQRDVTDKDVGKNEPLTLDELRKMDNQPVWIEDVGEYKWHGSGWAIVDREYCLVRKASNGNPAFFERYGKEWIAYRQKPEEDDHA